MREVKEKRMREKRKRKEREKIDTRKRNVATVRQRDNWNWDKYDNQTIREEHGGGKRNRVRCTI